VAKKIILDNPVSNSEEERNANIVYTFPINPTVDEWLKA